jgi:hypothetical protein
MYAKHVCVVDGSDFVISKPAPCSTVCAFSLSIRQGYRCGYLEQWPHRTARPKPQRLFITTKPIPPHQFPAKNITAWSVQGIRTGGMIGMVQMIRRDQHRPTPDHDDRREFRGRQYGMCGRVVDPDFR